MPWRNHPDPYAVWISEIMLQQTQVETVKHYFARFIAAFPTVASLAAAPQQDVLKAWEGLGYYTRARNLQKAAQQIAQSGGKLPTTAHDWNMLSGIGTYTAAAIASICFHECVPVVDGNVARVFARYLMWSDDFRKPVAREKLAQWLTPLIKASKRPGDFNQAMMDLGATCCTPRAPTCPACPLHATCRAKHHHVVSEFPVKPEKKRIPHHHDVGFIVRDSHANVLLAQRTKTALLHGLWELPSCTLPSAKQPTYTELCACFKTLTGLTAQTICATEKIRHLFSHFKQTLQCYTIARWEGSLTPQTEATLRFVIPETLPLTTVARRALGITDDRRSATGATNGRSSAKTRKNPPETSSSQSC
jgi:A/G-specific adenine glycosylase